MVGPTAPVPSVFAAAAVEAVASAAALAEFAASNPACKDAAVTVATDAPLSSTSATPAVPENEISECATPAASIRDVVVRRMLFC